MIPTIERVKENCRKKCGHCEKKVMPGDLVISYCSSAYAGNVNYRWLHLECLIDASGKDVGFDAIMTALGKAK